MDSVARVTFTLPSFLWADAIFLVGEFNDWTVGSHPLRQDRTGTWTLTLDLEPNRTYLFGYVCDGRWFADDHADRYVWNAEGTRLFLVDTGTHGLLPQMPLTPAEQAVV
jgi:1,4-alpha-glucan branching enzyme